MIVCIYRWLKKAVCCAVHYVVPVVTIIKQKYAWHLDRCGAHPAVTFPFSVYLELVSTNRRFYDDLFHKYWRKPKLKNGPVCFPFPSLLFCCFCCCFCRKKSVRKLKMRLVHGTKEDRYVKTHIPHDEEVTSLHISESIQ